MTAAAFAAPKAQAAVDYDPFAGGALARVVPTTEPQREVWLADRLGRDASLAFNESVSLRLRGALDARALAGALQDLVDRHDALRASFGPDGETLCVLERREIALDVQDLTTLSPPARADAVAACLRAAVEAPFALEHDPLLRAELLCLADDEHLLILTAHHIVCDGWSWWVLVRELGALYARHRGIAGEPLPPPASFAEYALAEAMHPAGPTYAADEAYWLSRFAGTPPVLELPTGRPRPARRGFASAREDYVFGAELVGAIRRMGARRGASLFATLLAGFSALLARIAGQSDVVVGIPAAGQSVDGHDDLVGHCVNLLPLRSDVDLSQPFAHALDAAQATLLDALEHQRYTFGTLLRKLRIARDPARLPLVSVMFNIDQALDHESTDFPGLTLDFATNPRNSENFELFINAVQAGGELRLECQYSHDLFDAATVRRWLAAYETLLRAAVERPDAALACLPLVDAAMRAELEALQPAPAAFDRECGMHEHFERQCDRAPQRIAARCGSQALTYAELETRANRIAHLLRARGVHRGALVGLALDRGIDMLGALLGVLKCGAGYVPLDPNFPAERLRYMAGDAGLAALVTQRRHAASFDLRGRPVLTLDDLATELDAASTARIGRDEQAAAPESVAYVIYTSGSTGRPKGVQVPHRAVANFLESMRREPGLGEGDRLMAVTTLSFDIAVLELLLPLSVGAEVVLADTATAGDGAALASLLAATQASAMQATPATWRMLIDAGWSGGPQFKALCGGEALAPDLAAQLLPRCGELWNLYGPTETTVWSTCARIAPPASRQAPDISIGRPIANTRIWILDANAEPCPPGVPGEICIGGEGVTLGYLGRPELTAERFVPDRFCDFACADRGAPAAMLYRTGDRGCWRADGNLEHLGRLDFQVKVRGYRIELGEIENVLGSHPDVARAVAVVREDRPGDVRLVTYAVARPGAAIDETALAAHLRTALPDYMIPQHILALAALPLLPNGKIDRRALPAPGLDERRAPAQAAPRNALERSIAAAMAQVLGVPQVGIDDDFFALGGHSLLAAQLTSRLNRELGASLSLRALFDGPTVAKLAALVAGHDPAIAQAPRAPILHRADQRRAPLSLMQQRLWVLEQMEPGRVTYNTPSAHRLTGPFDADAFQRAFRELVRRQASLRTVIVADGDGAVQLVRDDVDASLPIEDLSSLPPDEREAALFQRLEALTAEPFRLDEGPLFRARLFRLAEQEHALFFMTHHIIWDGWSFDLLYAEMAALYEAFCEGRPSPLPELEVSYGDFTEWHLQWLRGAELDAQLAHWKQHLAGELEPLQLPQDHPRPAETTGGGGTEWVRIDRALTDALREVGTGADATLFMTLLAAYYALLHRLTGQRDLVVGLPVRGRGSEALEPVMGFFVNMLPLRLRIDPDMPFGELVRAVREAVVDSFAYPDVPFEHLVRELHVPRDTSRSPIYQALFSFQDVRQRRTRWGGLQHEHLLIFQRGTSNDVGLWFLEHAEGLSGGLTYNTDILSAETATLLHRRFLALLDSVRRDPNVAVGDADILCAEDRCMLTGWNATAAELPAARSLHALLQAQAERTPERPAIRFGNETMSYAALQARSARIADSLHGRGVRAGDLVGVCLDRSPDLIAAMIAVLKLGAAYVPLDPAYPAERLRFMAEDAMLAMVASQADLADPLVWPRERLLLLDADAQAIETAPARDAGDDPTTPDSVAYVIYTSGSTGRPKGVRVPHRAVLNFLHSMRSEPGLGSDDRLLAVTTTSFDIAVLEIFLPLSVGAEVLLASRETAMDGHALATLLDASGATVMQATPASWRMLLDAGWRGRPGFKALCGGEALAPDLAAQLSARCAEVWNMYGPTETTVWSTCCRIDSADRDITIGRPIANTTVHILDARLQPCPIGVPGEICIGGAGVALDYLDRAELTAERFIADRFADGAQSGGAAPRLYRTGDRGRWRADGRLEHLGRLDFQIKLRGHRIELGEIENRLLSHADIARAVVMPREDRPGDVRLVAYVVTQPGTTADPQMLLAHLRQTLPDYMIPQHVVALDAMPLLPNGKVDRGALPAPTAGAPAAQIDSGRDLPEDPRVTYLVAVWSELLGMPAGPADNFFDLGGHSMLAVQMANRVARDTGVRLKLMRLATQTLAQIAVELPQTTGARRPERRFGPRIARGLMRLLGRDQASSR